MSRGNYYSGTWESGRGQVFDRLPPFPGAPTWEGAYASAEQATNSVAAAAAAFPAWAQLSLEERASSLEAFVNAVQERSETLASAIAGSIGKPLWEAKTEVGAVIAKFKPSVAAARVRLAEFRPAEAGGTVHTSFRPHGATVVLGPFNFPLHMPNTHIIPALLAGNTVVFKPSPLAPLAAEMYAECFASAHLPLGVFNMVQGGADIGAALVEDVKCKAICFTGSATVGRQLEEVALRKRIMIAAEMGGNSPIVIWDTSDLRSAVYIALQSCFVTAGQRCSSARRVIVPKGAFGDAFISAFIKASTELTIGLPFDDPQPFYGPMVSVSAAERALVWQHELESRGANVLLRAIQSARSSALLSPGIVDVTPLAIGTLPDQEVLGPVVVVQRCSTFDEAIHLCNRTQYGLAAGLLTEDENKYAAFSAAIEAGVLAWNVPLTGSSAWAAFGGMKSSGNYRPTGFYSADYCARAVGATESPQAKLPPSLSPGITV